MKLSHVAEKGGEHEEVSHNFSQHCLVLAQSEVVLADQQEQSEQIQESTVADRQEFISCENQEQLLVEDLKVADSEESATQHDMEADLIITDRQELSLSCSLSEEKLFIPQLLIIEPEKLKIIPELKTAEFIEAGISGYDNISRDENEVTKDEFVNNIQINSGDAISTKSFMVGESVVNDTIIGKSADTFRGGTYFDYMNNLIPADVYAEYYQRKDLYQLTKAEVIKTEAKSESPVYYL